MTRKKLPLAIAALTAGMFGSSVVYALGLGEIKLYSHLNEPLQAEVDLVQIGDLNADEIITKMASKEAFDKAGIDRDFFLTQIKFEVVIKPDGSGVLKLSTDKPTREPFLDFILDTSWSSGHVLKQYTLLLDPPTYTAEGAAPTASEPEPEAVVAPPAVEQASPESASVDATPSAEAVKPPAETKPTIPAGTERYTTQKNDTLWSIASKHQASGASVHETMDAIHKLNQDAFIKNNRNLLKTDKALRLPSPEEVAYLSQGGSVNQLLADQRQVAQAPQLSTDQTTAPVETTASDDKLKIVGSSTATESTGASAAGTSETIDKIDRDNQDMNVRLAELTSQIKTMQQLIQMQDQQLTSLQQQLGGGAPQKAEMKEAVEKLKAELSKVESEIDKAPATSTEVSVTEAPSTTPTTAETAAPTTAATTTASTESTAVTQPTTAPTVAPVATQPPAAKPTEQKAVEVAPVEEESNSSWIAWLVGILLGVGIAGAVLGKKLIDKRKAQQQPKEDVEETDWSVDALRNEPSLASMSEASEEVTTTTESDAHATQAANVHAEPKQAVDPLVEANELIAQGDLSGAMNLLKEAVSQNATRLDLRTRLLELCVDARDITTFEAQESYISRWGGAAAKQRVKELREVINAMPASASVASAETPSSAPMMDTSLDFYVDVTTPAIETSAEKAPDDELVSLDHLFDDAPAQVETESEEPAAMSSDSDDLASLEHLFGDSPIEVKTEQSISASDDLASLDHLFDTVEQAVVTSPSEVIEQPAPTNDDLASLDHLFDDVPAEVAKSDDIEFDLSDFAIEAAADKTAESELQQAAETDSQNDTSGEIDFSGELGLLDEEATTSVAEPELDMSAALEELSTLAEETPSIDVEVAPDPEPEQVAAPAAATSNEDDEFGFLAGTDEAATKLDLAKAYIDMEDIEGAKDILQEVLQEGNATQQQEAKDLLAKL